MKNTIPLPPYDILHTLFSYNPDTGLLTRKIKGKGGNAPAGSIVGTPNKFGHLKVKITTTKNLSLAFTVHRLIWLMQTNVDPLENDIDHKNRVPDDNRWTNLRMVSHSINSFNSCKHTTGIYPGVHKRGNRFIARIMVDYQRVQLGSFVKIEDAIACRKEAELRLASTRNDEVMLLQGATDNATAQSP